MLSVVCLSICPQGVGGGKSMDHYLWCIGHHCTGPTPPPDMRPHYTGERPPGPGSPRHGTSLYRIGTPTPPHLLDMGLHWTGPQPGPPHWYWHLVAKTRDLFILVHLGDPTVRPLPHSTDIWWLLKHVRLASGRYASYWNAFLVTSCVQAFIKPM